MRFDCSSSFYSLVQKLMSYGMKTIKCLLNYIVRFPWINEKHSQSDFFVFDIYSYPCDILNNNLSTKLFYIATHI